MNLELCKPVMRSISAGWLAASPPEYPYRIGVTGSSQEEALRLFAEAVTAWRELHSRPLAERRS